MTYPVQGPHVSLRQELETLHVILLSTNQIRVTVSLLANTFYGQGNIFPNIENAKDDNRNRLSTDSRPDPQKGLNNVSTIRVNDETVMVLASNCSKLNDRKLVCNNMRYCVKFVVYVVKFVVHIIFLR